MAGFPSLTGDLIDPVAVFDAGIGSYALVDLIRKTQPQRDIIYFADRARFPYGAKTHDELMAIMSDSIQYLADLGAGIVVLASNAPSIMVLAELQKQFRVPIFGVAPPVRQALALSRTGRVAIMGVQSMIESAQLQHFIERHVADASKVTCINASSMVELVESGAFLLDPERTSLKVAAICDQIAAKYPEIDVLTLSSTHLPWLRPFFENARHDWHFLDPAEDVIAALPQPLAGSGQTIALVTENETYTAAGFKIMLEKLGVVLPLTVVNPSIGRSFDMHV